MSGPIPRILFVDDEPEKVEQLARLCEPRASTQVFGPTDVTLEILEAADLVLVDFALDEWFDRDISLGFSQCPMDGLALVEIYRAALRKKKIKKPVAFGVLTGELASLTDPFPASAREHMVAGAVKIEWAFQKGTPSDVLVKQFLGLGTAVLQLPFEWPHSSSAKKDEILLQLLGVDSGAQWNTVAYSDISRCHPPIRELSVWSHGLAFIRWTLHRVLPYPCFLIDTRQVASRLRISHQSFNDAITNNEALVQRIKDALYTGILSEFDGRRWWKSGLEAIIWELTQEDPFSLDLLRKKVSELCPSAQFLEVSNPVICVDGDYRGTDEVADASECVRLLPDDWPFFAERPWARRSDVMADDRLRMVVLEEDRSLLEVSE